MSKKVDLSAYTSPVSKMQWLGVGTMFVAQGLGALHRTFKYLDSLMDHQVLYTENMRQNRTAMHEDIESIIASGGELTDD